MALTVTHAFVSAIADDPVADAAGEVVPSDWNADHTISVTSLTIATGTITASEPTLDLSQTWDNAAVTFTGIKLNVTNTASAAGSLLADWQVGGVSKASITVGGRVASGATWAAGQAQFYNLAAGPGAGLSISASGEDVDLVANGICVLTVDAAQGYRLHGDYPFGFVNGHARNNVSDVRLWRDAAATLALRNSTTAQTFRVYGTYTDSSNYVRASLSSSSTAVTLAAETAGTGADNIDLLVKPAGTGSVVVPTTSGAGIKVDTTTPTFGWRDITSDIVVRGTGANDPAWVAYTGLTEIYAYRFSASTMMQAWFSFHVPHDYVPGTDVYLHVHWSNAAATPNTGNVIWGFDYTYAAGHNQAAFGAASNTTVTQASSATRYQHMIAETGAITLSGLEADALILVRVYRDAADGGDTCTDAVFLHTADIHYQSTNLATKNKAPTFY